MTFFIVAVVFLAAGPAVVVAMVVVVLYQVYVGMLLIVGLFFVPFRHVRVRVRRVRFVLSNFRPVYRKVVPREGGARTC